MKKILEKYLIITFGAILYAFGMSCFLDPNHLAPGGVGGIAIILNAITPIETGTWIFLINIPILILALWKFGWRFTCSTVYVVAVSSVAINYFSRLGSFTTVPLLAALGGALLVSTGLGIIFKGGSTSGGTDIIVKVLRQHFPHLKTGTLFMMTDVVIVALSAIVFGDFDTAMYAAISAYAQSVVLDMVLYGKDEAKLLLLISDHAETLKKRLLLENIGLTELHGAGAFGGNQKTILLSVVRKHKYPAIEEIVKSIDPDAFLIVTSASEVYGEGYKSLFMEKL